MTRPHHLDEVDLAAAAGKGGNGAALAHGLGRSYGDSALNEGGALIMTRGLDRILSTDWTTGVVRAEAGLSLDTLMPLSVPRGWFPAVAPGTKVVTLAGAVANDVHGKTTILAAVSGRIYGRSGSGNVQEFVSASGGGTPRS